MHIWATHEESVFTSDVSADKICPYSDWVLLSQERHSSSAIVEPQSALHYNFTLSVCGQSPFVVAFLSSKKNTIGIILNIFASPGQRWLSENNSFKRDGALC